MKLSEIKSQLKALEQLKFEMPDGSMVPEHFHVTEIGVLTKNFIDCGGTIRKERVANFQLWEAGDFDHRLAPQKLIDIIQLSEEQLGIEESLSVEVEYQGTTIGKYGLGFNGKNFVLTNTQTDCLAKDKCGIPEAKIQVKPKVKLADMTAGSNNSCEPGNGCC